MTSFPLKRIVKVTGAHVLGRYTLVGRPAYVYTSNIIGLISTNTCTPATTLPSPALPMASSPLPTCITSVYYFCVCELMYTYSISDIKARNFSKVNHWQAEFLLANVFLQLEIHVSLLK